MAARIDNGRVQLVTRTGLDWTDKYPSAVAALANLNVKTAYLDGELCGVDEAGRRASPKPRRRPTANAMCNSSITLSISCISTVGIFLRLQLIERKALLEPLLANKPGVQFNGHESARVNSSSSTPANSGLRAWCPRRSMLPMRRETAAYGAKPNG